MTGDSAFTAEEARRSEAMTAAIISEREEIVKLFIHQYGMRGYNFGSG